jgi:hypothetical protein
MFIYFPKYFGPIVRFVTGPHTMGNTLFYYKSRKLVLREKLIVTKLNKGKIIPVIGRGEP